MTAIIGDYILNAPNVRTFDIADNRAFREILREVAESGMTFWTSPDGRRIFDDFDDNGYRTGKYKVVLIANKS